MKKDFLILGVAAMALASCTNEEVVNIAENRAIGFDSFVNKNTRAVNDLTGENFSKFFVFGDYDNGASIAYSNTGVNGSGTGAEAVWTPENLAFWMDGKTYTFGAYANGSEGTSAKLTDVKFENGSLTISNYNVGDKDLIAAVTTGVNAPASGTEQNVNLSFKHLLSKIKFTFSTDAEPAAYRMEVSDLQIANAMKNTTSVTVGANGITAAWSGELDGIYEVATLSDFAVGGKSASTEENYVIPQNNESLNATFTVTVYDEETDTPIATGTFTAPLATGGLENANTWVNGYAYNYTAKINPDEVDPEKPLKPINFVVDKVEDWVPADNTPTTPHK